MNEMKLVFKSKLVNEVFARTSVVAFLAPLHLGMEIVILDIYDQGCGIEDIDLAMQPLYTSREDLERSGMGFTIMQSFADVFHIESRPGVGTSLHIEKKLQ